MSLAIAITRSHCLRMFAYANSIVLADFRKVLASVAHLSAQSRRHYGSTFLAIVNNANPRVSSAPMPSPMCAFRLCRLRPPDL